MGTTIKAEEFYYCPRCKAGTTCVINGEKDYGQMCPCPRGSCEAVWAGEIVVTVNLREALKPKHKEEILKYLKDV